MAVHSGVTGGSNLLPRSTGLTTLPWNSSDVYGKSPDQKRTRDKDEADFLDDLYSNKEDNVVMFSEVRSAFMEMIVHRDGRWYFNTSTSNTSPL